MDKDTISRRPAQADSISVCLNHQKDHHILLIQIRHQKNMDQFLDSTANIHIINIMVTYITDTVCWLQ